MYNNNGNWWTLIHVCTERLKTLLTNSWIRHDTRVPWTVLRIIIGQDKNYYKIN